MRKKSKFEIQVERERNAREEEVRLRNQELRNKGLEERMATVKSQYSKEVIPEGQSQVRMEKNIYFTRQGRYRVKIDGKWRGSFYTLDGARKEVRKSELAKGLLKAKDRLTRHNAVYNSRLETFKKKQAEELKAWEDKERVKQNDLMRDVGYHEEQLFMLNKKEGGYDAE